MKLIIDTMCFVEDSYKSDGGEIVVNAAPGLKIEDYNTPIIANLIERDIDLKTAQKYRIRQSAKKRIESFDWRVVRAEEREIIGVDGETVKEVLIKRETLRKASNRIETEIDSLSDESIIRQKMLKTINKDIPIESK